MPDSNWMQRSRCMIAVLTFSCAASVAGAQSSSDSSRVRRSLLDSATGKQWISSATAFPILARKLPFVVDKIGADKMPVPSLLSGIASLQGKVAGIWMEPSSGLPSASLAMQLRTPVTIRDTAGPLIVVDGVMLSGEFPTGTNDIESLDVANIEVLKGANASTLYGFRGMRGVIVVTTKRGSGVAPGRPVFSLRNEIGNGYALNLLDPVLAHPYRVNANGQYVDATGAVVSREKRVRQANGIAENRFIVPTYDHDAQVFRGALVNTQTVSLSQNRASTNYNISYARTQQPSVVDGADGVVRHSARVNVDQRFKDRVSVGLSASHTTGTEQPTDISLLDMMLIGSDIDLRAPNSGAIPFVRLPDAPLPYVNPLVSQRESEAAVRRQRTLLNLNVSARATSWLSFQANGSYDRAFRDFKQRSDVEQLGNGRFSEYRSLRNDSVAFGQFQGGITAARMLGRWSTQFALRGTTEREAGQQSTFMGQRIVTPGQPDAVGGYSTSLRQMQRRIVAGIGDLNVDYAGKYVADVALRREGNSVYATQKQWTTFIRGSAAWLLNEESWLPFQSLDLFKLHYSVGTSETAGRGVIVFVPIGAPIPPGPKTFIVTERELGLDLVVNSRFSSRVTYASPHSRDDVPITFNPPFSLTGNPTGLRGNTLEGTVQTRLINRENGLQWNMSVVADRRKTRISHLQASCFFSALQRLCEGTELSEIWGQRLLRNKSALPARHSASSAAFDVNDDGYVVPVGVGNTWRDGKSKNLWGTNVSIDGVSYRWGLPIVERDSEGVTTNVQLGETNPSMRYGVQNHIQFKWLRLYGLISGQVGGKLYDQTREYMYRFARHPDVDQSGKPEELRKPEAYYSAVALDGNGYVEEMLGDAGYARLSEASVGFSFRANKFGFLRSIGASRLDIDLIGRNLFTITGYKGANPQSPSYTVPIDDLRVPLSRTFTLATSIVF